MICVIEKCNQSAINTKAYKGFLILFEKTFSLFNDLQKVSFFWPGKQEFMKFVLQINKFLQIKVWTPDGRIICRSKFNLPIQDLCADQSSISRWKNFLQIKEPSADWRMICHWFKTDFQLQLTDLQLMSPPVELYYCYYTQTDMTDK